MGALHIGLIGLGRMGQVHARILARQASPAKSPTEGSGERSRRVERARLVAVADVDRERAHLTAKRLDIPHWYDNPGDLLARSDIQAVYIATPSHTHPELVEAAARSGKDIFCEKPLALTLAETDRAIAAVAHGGVRLQLGFMRRTQPDYLRVKSAIQSGALGRPVLFRSTQRDVDAPPASFCDPAVSGGIFVDMGVHEFDLARWLFDDEIRVVQAVGSALVFPALAAVGDLDNACVNLRFGGGAVGTVDLSRNARYGEDIRTEIVGSAGGMFVGAPPVGSLSHHDLDAIIDDQYRPESQAFVRALLDDGEVPATGADSRAALAIALAARESAQTGKTIVLG
ncbi:MAG TPA: Gfo/Idh/MocA family oxidoreductase [Anaerolineae bacterium]|nr:Gfo/Idh/MocA family oxidoreductase [Anaerolineae bacterium]